jgi:hypothetical protein
MIGLLSGFGKDTAPPKRFVEIDGHKKSQKDTRKDQGRVPLFLFCDFS